MRRGIALVAFASTLVVFGAACGDDGGGSGGGGEGAATDDDAGAVEDVVGDCAYPASGTPTARLGFLTGISCEKARQVVDQTPPGADDYIPFTVTYDDGTKQEWGTGRESSGAGQFPYQTPSFSAYFIMELCPRPQSC